MIVSEKYIKEIIHASQVNDIQMVALIRQYIFELKGVDANIRVPDDLFDGQLLHIAFNKACDYYYQKYDT